MNTLKRLLAFFSSKTFLYITLAWFGLQGIYFAVSIKLGIPPDENYHFTYIRFFSDNTFTPFPAHQDGYNVVLDAVHSPFFLYHYIFAFPYKLISGFSNAYILLRLLNVGLGIATLLLISKLGEFLKISALARNLSIFMLANTLMFTFIFSSISYDNMFIFISIASVFLLLKLLKKFNARTFLLLLASLSAGVLTKINFLPMAFIVFVIFAIKYYKKPVWCFQKLKSTFNDYRRLNVCLALIIGFLGILIIQRHVFNEIHYGKFEPACNKVRTLQECRRSELFVRNEMIYSPNHPPADRDFIQYSKGWLKLIEDRTFGAFAQRTILANKLIVYWSLIILLTGIVIAAVRWKKINNDLKILIYIISFYTAIVFITNLNNYHSSGRIDFAVHGRYLFCILPLIYLLWNHLIIERLKQPTSKAIYVLVSVIIFFVCAFPVFIQNVTPVWYSHWYQRNFLK